MAGVTLPPDDVKLIEEATIYLDTKCDFSPRKVESLLTIITKLQAALEFIMQQEPALSDHGKDKVRAILNGEVK